MHLSSFKSHTERNNAQQLTAADTYYGKNTSVMWYAHCNLSCYKIWQFDSALLDTGYLRLLTISIITHFNIEHSHRWLTFVTRWEPVFSALLKRKSSMFMRNLLWFSKVSKLNHYHDWLILTACQSDKGYLRHKGERVTFAVCSCLYFSWSCFIRFFVFALGPIEYK